MADANAMAEALWDDICLVVRHAWTVPWMFGGLSWYLYDRYLVERWLTEMSVTTYPYEYFRMSLQLFSVVPAVAILFALVVSLCFQRLGFTLPFALSLSVARGLHRFPWWRIPTPNVSLAKGSSILPHTTVVAVCESEGGGTEEQVFFYLNGMVEQGTMTEGTARVLGDMTGRIVNVLTNPSEGFGFDLLESLLGRSLSTPAPFIEELTEVIGKHLSIGRRVVLIAHSQGGIVASNIVEAIQGRAASNLARGNNELHAALERFEVFTFCSGARYFRVLPGYGIKAEHFASELDVVSRIGVLANSGHIGGADGEIPENDGWSGPVYMLRRDQPGNGHLMKEMILPMLRLGHFGGDSRFMNRYVNSDALSFQPVMSHLAEFTTPE